MNPWISNRTLIALGFGLSLLAPLVAQSAPAAELRGYIVGGAAFSPGFYFSQSVMPANATSSVVRSVSDTGSDGSYADGNVAVFFGNLHSYSDAHEVNTGGGAPQSHASSEFIDYIEPWASSPVGFTFYNLTLTISGSHSPTNGFGPYPGYTAQGSLRYDIRDNQTGDVFASGYYDTNDSTPPSFTVSAGITVPKSEQTDDIRIDISLDTYAYVSNLNPAYQTAVADYSHTLVVHLDAVTPGASTLGASGFDYATVASVPEPSTWLTLIAGIAVLGISRRGSAAADSVARPG